MKLLTYLSLCSSAIAVAETAPDWMRYPMVSPDGTAIAFTYQGDIYRVPVQGGTAKRLTSHPAYDSMPIWSHDSKKIAFSSNRNGNFDVYVMEAEGGMPQRVTTHSGKEQPYCFSRDNKEIYFGAATEKTATNVQFPHRSSKELYRVDLNGGRPIQVLSNTAENAVISKDEKTLLYNDNKGPETEWRKHHTSSIARDVWAYDTTTGKHTKLTTFAGEDRNPVFTNDGKHIYYLSEQKGSFNVWQMELAKPANTKQISFFQTHPVRFLSSANDGTLCYGYNGQIYTQKPGKEPKKININIASDVLVPEKQRLRVPMTNGIASPDGKQIAFTYRGDIFITATDYATTKQITSTPEIEETPTFSADGRSIAYAAYRNGIWNIYSTSIVRKDDPNFANSTLLEEKALIADNEHERTQPQYSPDGKELAFYQDRSKLMVLNLESGKVRQITDGSTVYNTDRQTNYTWSPDSQWIAFSHVSNKHDPYYDIAIVNAQGGEITHITQSGYFDHSPRWSMDGNALIFATERYGMRSHASWGSQFDIMMVFMNQEAMDKYYMTKEERELADAAKKKAEEEAKKAADEKAKEKAKSETKDKAETKADEAKKGKEEKPKEEKKLIKVELKGIEDRIVRLTPTSTNLNEAILNKDGTALYYICAFQKGHDLWKLDLLDRSMRILKHEVGPSSMMWNNKHDTLFILGKNPMKFEEAKNHFTLLSAYADMALDKSAEREAMFNYVYREIKRRFYVTDLHGVNWEEMRANYAKFLPHINNSYDFAEMVSELLGELNVSHTGCYYRTPYSPNADDTAELGLFYDHTYTGDGLKVTEVLEGGPLDKAHIDIKPGDIITAINGTKITAGKDYYPLLNHTAGRRTLISRTRSEGDKSISTDIIVKPVTKNTIENLLYKRWIKRSEETVDKLSNGRLGYVHIKSMTDDSFRSVYADVLGKFYNKDGIVIDTRFNGGGRLHEDLETFFSGEKYLTQVIRGKESCDMPSRRWNRASIMITGEANYSNAHGTPWVYRYKKMGTIVGMPVPGTMTSVCWEDMQDPSIVFGIPIVGYRLADGSYLENKQLEPDVKIANTPEKIEAGTDEQLEKAVKVLLQEIDTKSTKAK